MKWNKVCILILSLVSLSACTANDPTKVVEKGEKQPKSAKRGVAFNFSQVSDLPILSPYISWDYNWGNTPTDNAALWFDANEMDYCPMCWNGKYDADKIRAFVAAHPKTKYLLGFNEPNLTDQANMTPSQAAALWPQVVALAKELGLKLVSPAMNYGTLAGYNDPIKWLDEFFAQPGVSIDDIYAISVHCYMSSASAVQAYIEKFQKYDKPIWLTEFCAWDPVPGSVNTQMDYMCAVLNYLEQEPSVERYSWFIPRTSGKVDSPPYMQLLNHDDPSTLTDLGKIYCWFASMPENFYLIANQPIYAGEYTQVKNNVLSLRPCTDSKTGTEGLMVTNFAKGQEVTYHVYVPEESQQISLRYCGYADAICEVKVNGESRNYMDLPRTGSTEQWNEAFVSLPLKTGAYKITLSLFSGSCNISSFIIQ